MPERPAPKPEPDDSTRAEYDRVLSDDAQMKGSDKWRRPFGRRMAFEVRFGLGTPVGAAGLMLEYSFLPQLSVAAGGGIGSGTTNIFHGAIAVRARPAVGPTAHNAMVLEAAFSAGGYQRFDMGAFVPPVDGPAKPTPVEPSATGAHFLQFEAAWEHRSDNGFLIRLGGGIATMLNPGALQCPHINSSLQSCALDGNSNTQLVPVVIDLAVGQSF